MGCGGSKEITVEPVKIIYHPMNQFIDVNIHESPHIIYEILEYWFSSKYSQKDKEEHILPIDQLLELSKQIYLNNKQSKKVTTTVQGTPGETAHNEQTVQQVIEGEDQDNWDRHSTVYSKVIAKWFMGSQEQDIEIIAKFGELLQNNSLTQKLLKSNIQPQLTAQPFQTQNQQTPQINSQNQQPLIETPASNNALQNNEESPKPDENNPKSDNNEGQIIQSQEQLQATPPISQINNTIADQNTLNEEEQPQGWATNLHGRLALIILFDQMSRIIYRKQKEAFQYDDIAQKLCKDLLKNKKNEHLLLFYKNFELIFFMSPLMHSEQLGDVQLFVDSVQKLIVHYTTNQTILQQQGIDAKGIIGYFESQIKFAKDHIKILAKFGRYPHRNQVLERESTEEEIQYLQEM